VDILHQQFGIAQGMMTTIHAYTNDQSLMDTAHDDPYRGRAAALSMIPSNTGAAQAVGLVLPELAGRLDGMAIRVPTANVSMIDFHCVLKEEATAEAVNLAMKHAAEGQLQGVLAWNDKPLVSVDFCHHPASSIFDAGHTKAIGKQLKVMAWYDNEWGFANRLLDVCDYLQQWY
jgi:glyceraldehyde 3-phosphate dehydrogenase